MIINVKDFETILRAMPERALDIARESYEHLRVWGRFELLEVLERSRRNGMVTFKDFVIKGPEDVELKDLKYAMIEEVDGYITALNFGKDIESLLDFEQLALEVLRDEDDEYVRDMVNLLGDEFERSGDEYHSPALKEGITTAINCIIRGAENTTELLGGILAVTGVEVALPDNLKVRLDLTDLENQ